MRNRPAKRHGFLRLLLPPAFYPAERRVFCPCELCRLRFGVMLYNKVRGGEPLRSYRPGGVLRRRRRANDTL